MKVAILRRHLVATVLGEMPHPFFQVFGKLFVLPLEHKLYVTGGLLVLILRAKSFNAWAGDSV